MKQPFTFISRLALCAVAGGLSIGVANAQMEGNTDTGGDVSGHNTVDSPYLRPRSKPAQSAAAQSSMSQKDQKFLSQIAAGGVQVVQDARVAEKKGNDATKKVASRIASERGNSNKELLGLTKKKGLTLKTDGIKPRDMGKDYDKQYMRTTGGDLQADVKLLQTAAQSSDDKDIKAWAAKTAPMVKGHLSMVKSAK